MGELFRTAIETAESGEMKGLFLAGFFFVTGLLPAIGFRAIGQATTIELDEDK